MSKKVPIEIDGATFYVKPRSDVVAYLCPTCQEHGTPFEVEPCVIARQLSYNCTRCRTWGPWTSREKVSRSKLAIRQENTHVVNDA